MSSGYHRLKPQQTLQNGDDSPDSERTPFGAQIQNKKKTKVYVFGDDDVSEQDLYETNVEMSELRSRGKSSKQSSKSLEPEDNEPKFFEKNISEGETLQNISLKYGCQVADIKRLNKLIQDQDFFALKSIKVPLTRHGLLTELVEKENQNGNNVKMSVSSDSVLHVTEPNEDDAYSDGDDSAAENHQLLVRTLSIPKGNQGKQAADFLKKMDSDIKKIIMSTNTRKDNLEDVVDTLTERRFLPYSQQSRTWTSLCCNNWWGVVIIILVVGLVTPFLFFYHFDYAEPSDTTTSTFAPTHIPAPSGFIPVVTNPSPVVHNISEGDI